MPKALQNIISLRNKFSNVHIKTFGFEGEIDSISKEDIEELLQVKDHLREFYYIEDEMDSDLIDLEVGRALKVIIDLSQVPNYYNTVTDFLNSNKIRLKHDEFYIHEIKYHEGYSQKNNFIENYKVNTTLINFLSQISNYDKPAAGELELFFYNSDISKALKIDYSKNTLDKITPEYLDVVKELIENFQNRTDSKERKQLFINELINLLDKQGNIYPVIIDNWTDLITNYKNSFSLYLSGFSFEKVKTASIEYFHELTDRIHSTLLNYSVQVFAIPIAYVLLIRFFDFSGDNILKDSFLVILGIIFYLLIRQILFSNINDAILAIKTDIESFQKKIEADTNLKSIKDELDDHYNKTIPKLEKKLRSVKIITCSILLTLMIAYCVIHYPKLKMIISKNSITSKAIIVNKLPILPLKQKPLDAKGIHFN